MSEHKLCGIKLSDYLIRVEEFHGYRSPGLLLGGMMLNIGIQQLEPTPYLNVVTETVVCLPDAVQLLTPCTVGNGFLQILDWGKFAFTGYDRLTLAGIRVWLNTERLTGYPKVHSWFERSAARSEKPPFEDLIPEILAAGANIIDHRPVRLHRALKDFQHVLTGCCPTCGESYRLDLGAACPACQNEAYYVYQK